jgi:hypothetical protein
MFLKLFYLKNSSRDTTLFESRNFSNFSLFNYKKAIKAQITFSNPKKERMLHWLSF